MRLHLKIALYNIITKIAIIAISAIVISSLTSKISTNHLQQRLVDKSDKLIRNLSTAEIKDLVNLQRTFMDYNILKEEYIVIEQNRTSQIPSAKPSFISEERVVDGETEEYLILQRYFNYSGKTYKLEIGQTTMAVGELEKTILYFSIITMIVSIAITLIIDMGFMQFLLRPFYWIVDNKINNVNDPIHFNYAAVDTSTEDFKLLDDSISLMMKKISGQIIKEKQFISNVSHELLTPISIMMSRLENLLNDEELSDEGMNKVVASLRTLARLKAIIHSLLLISKIENSQYEKKDEIALSNIIQEIYEELKDRLIEKHIRFEMNINHAVVIKGNEALIHILCTNIINNAIKYNRRNGKVSISDRFANGFYYIRIKDEGTGMKPDEIEQAFSRFERLGTTEADSHGLGLAIVKSIASFHQIGVKIYSEKGQGTEVELQFRPS